VCTEAVAVVRAVGADFFLDHWHVIMSDNSSIQHIPWYIVKVFYVLHVAVVYRGLCIMFLSLILLLIERAVSNILGQ
jgi:hypothetical protein